MYKICAWDIGIKTLSYCIFEVNKETSQWFINDWSLINLLENKSHKCITTLKNGKACISNATFYGKNYLNEEYYLCGKHKNSFDKKISSDICQTSDNGSTCEYETKKLCGKKAYFKYNNVNLCTQHKKMNETKLLKSFELKKIKKNTCADSLKPQDICINIYNELSKRPLMANLDEILIENQPSLINPIMKAISSFVFGYYVFTDKQTNHSSKIKFIAPSGKLDIDYDTLNRICQTIMPDDAIYKKLTKILNLETITPTMLIFMLGVVINKGLIDVMVSKYNEPDTKQKLKKLINIEMLNNIDEINKTFATKEKFEEFIKCIRVAFYKNNTDKGTCKGKSKGKDTVTDTNIETLIDTDTDTIKDKTTKDRYELIKLLSIKYTLILISNNGEWANHLDNYKKKDDVCDAFLHGYKHVIEYLNQ